MKTGSANNKTSQADPNCIFCGVVSGQTPADLVHQSPDTIWFRDISPKARVHILGIPRRHIESVRVLAEADQAVIGRLIREAGLVAQQAGVEQSGFRLIVNTGPDSGQEVKHVHFHLLGGQRLGPLCC